MRILMLNHNVAWSGGTFFRAFHFGKQLVDRGHSVTLMSISPSQKWRLQSESRDGLEIVYSPDLFWGMGRTGWDPWDTLRRMGFLWSRQWDIIHAWDTRPAVIFPALLARKRSSSKDCKLVIDWCDWWGRGGTQLERPGGLTRYLYNPIETFFEEHFRKRADGTTVISTALRRRAAELGVPLDTIRLLPHGCEPDEGLLPVRRDARMSLAIEERRSVLITVGALNTSDADLLFRTMYVLRERSPELRLFMIGKHRSRVPEDLRKDGTIVETGFVTDEVLRIYMAAADALVVPLADTIASRARWPSKVNSFLAGGPVVVMTRVGDLAALLEAEGGAVVCDSSADALAEGVLSVIATPERRAQIEACGRTLAEKRLSWPLLTGELEKFYQSLRRGGCHSN